MRYFAAAAAAAGLGVLTFLVGVLMEDGFDGLIFFVLEAVRDDSIDEGQLNLRFDQGMIALGFLAAFPVAGYTFYRVVTSPRWKL